MRGWRTALVGVALASGVAVPTLGAGAATSRAAVPTCTPSAMGVSLGMSQGAAGTIYHPIVFTNHGPACAIWGVPYIQPVVGAAHTPVGAPARNLSMGQMPLRQVVAKGKSVSVAFGAVETANFTPSKCLAKHADGVMVTLGGSVRRTYVHLSLSVCTKLTSVTTRLIAPGSHG